MILEFGLGGAGKGLSNCSLTFLFSYVSGL